MKIAVLIIITLFSSETSVIDISKFRDDFAKAATDKQLAKRLLQKVESHNNSSSYLMQGYKGAITMILAKFQYNPITKLDYFNSGKNILQEAIQKDYNNTELRFIRFSVQSNIPFFLNYHNDLMTDKKFLLLNLPDIKDKDLKKRITSFLKASPYLSTSERHALSLK